MSGMHDWVNQLIEESETGKRFPSLERYLGMYSKRRIAKKLIGKRDAARPTGPQWSVRSRVMSDSLPDAPHVAIMRELSFMTLRTVIKTFYPNDWGDGSRLVYATAKRGDGTPFILVLFNIQERDDIRHIYPEDFIPLLEIEASTRSFYIFVYVDAEDGDDISAIEVPYVYCLQRRVCKGIDLDEEVKWAGEMEE